MNKKNSNKKHQNRSFESSDNEFCDKKLWDRLTGIGELSHEDVKPIEVIITFKEESFEKFVKKLERSPGNKKEKNTVNDEYIMGVSAKDFVEACYVDQDTKDSLNEEISDFVTQELDEQSENRVESYLNKIATSKIPKIEVNKYGKGIELPLQPATIRSLASLLQDNPDAQQKLGIEFIEEPIEFEEYLDKSAVQVGVNPHIWNLGYEGEGIVIGVLDSGFDQNHEDFDQQILDYQDFTGDGTEIDSDHGTHVASTIAGSGVASEGRFKGIAPKSKLLVAKVLSKKSKNTQMRIINGLSWAVQNGADIVNMSLGSKRPNDGNDILSKAVNRAVREDGVVVCVAAGNAGFDRFTGEPQFETIGTPGSAINAITVGAVDPKDIPAKFSSKGPVKVTKNSTDVENIKPDIVAPGVGIIAALGEIPNRVNPPRGQIDIDPSFDGKYVSKNGTSMATPIVSGVCALMLECYKKQHQIDNPKKWKKQKQEKIDGIQNLAEMIKQVILDTALQMDSLFPEMEVNATKSIVHGTGRIQADLALNVIAKKIVLIKPDTDIERDPVKMLNKVINDDYDGLPIKTKIKLRSIQKLLTGKLMDLLASRMYNTCKLDSKSHSLNNIQTWMQYYERLKAKSNAF